MNAFILILFMVAVGALIGGVTNHLAIKMLFRPYRAYYIGKFRIPFTPGLIPRRRDELAVSMGKTVVDHLLTPDSLQKKLLNPAFKGETVKWLKAELTPIFQSETPIEEWLEELNIPVNTMMIHDYLDKWIETKVIETRLSYANRSLGETIPFDWKEKAEEKIPEIVTMIAGKAEDYFTSPEGKAKVKVMIDDFLKERGMLGNMLGMFLGNTSVADKVQPEIVKFIKHPGTQEILLNLIRSEWEKLQEKTVGELTGSFSDEALVSSVQSYAKRTLKIGEFFARPLGSVLSRHEEIFSISSFQHGWIVAPIFSDASSQG
ncbi:DUF445 family protein [Rossellomorea marisflavi]|uniref:DUF445 domain-containing protein n=1 Tax=Rossellomorea marisflavi TaxID=189381 RepID=UPI00203C17AF|nr:DUF445 family protein [Rossellomorea marisflavi]MCM2606481.1 DUF445 family protein [Rossellomorea marisflavi]